MIMVESLSSLYKTHKIPTIKDKNSNIGRIFVAKNRNGPDGIIFSIFMDTGSVSIKVLEQDDVCQIQRDEQRNRNQRDLDTAKRIYKQMLKQKEK